MNKMPLYLDSASTTPVDPRVIEAMLPYFSEIFGNASSNHIYGKQAKNAIEVAREQVAKLINADNKEIIFTSGATESINLAIKGFVEANMDKGKHIITVKTEHKAVLATCEYLETKGFEVTYLDVDENGLVLLDELTSAITNTTLLIAVMYVNNEIGIIQPISEIGKIARNHNICFFCDATQAVGKIKVDVEIDNIDMLCFSGHKLNGPKGIGVLYKKSNLELIPLFHGGDQENGLRAGTYNTPLVVGLGKACEITQTEFDLRLKQTLKKRSEVFEILHYEEVSENFIDIRKVPNIISLIVTKGYADDFLIKNSKFFIASTGSACISNVVNVSHVIQNIFPKELHNKIIRISI